MNNRWPKSKATEAAAAILGLCLLAFVIIDEFPYQSLYLGGRRSLAEETSQLIKDIQNKLETHADENYKVLQRHRELSTPNLVGQDPMFKLTPEVIPPAVADTVRLITVRLLENADGP